MEMTYSKFENRYRDKQYIGSGGFAKVFKVFDHANNHYVAMKIADVRPEWKQFTLRREVELVNSLAPHRNIARYDACYRFNTGITGEMDFAILKFYEYGNLEQFISREEELTKEDIKLIIRGILEGVAFLHRNQVIHRDMKSQNILINREDGVWTPKIIDFGLSRILSGEYTATNSAVGLTFAYAAPEQIRNQKIYKNVDLWAIGVIIYRVIAGELPFQAARHEDSHSAQSQLELSQKITNLDLPEKLERLPEPYRSMIKRCLVVDPSKRVATAEDLLEMLNEQDQAAAPQPIETPAPFSDSASPLGAEPAPAVEEHEVPAVYPTAPDYNTPSDNPTKYIEPKRVTIPNTPRPATGSPRPWRRRYSILLILAAAALAVWAMVWWNGQKQNEASPPAYRQDQSMKNRDFHAAPPPVDAEALPDSIGAEPKTNQ